MGTQKHITTTHTQNTFLPHTHPNAEHKRQVNDEDKRIRPGNSKRRKGRKKEMRARGGGRVLGTGSRDYMIWAYEGGGSREAKNE